MEAFFAFLIKLVIIFAGGGVMSLIALKVAEEASSIPELIFQSEKNKQSNSIKILNKKNVISKSGLYELILPGGNTLKIFSSFTGMKILKG